MADVDRVTLFIDYLNVYATARAHFHHESDPPQHGHIWPVALSPPRSGSGCCLVATTSQSNLQSSNDSMYCSPKSAVAR
jgi:hypothetical protein